MPKIKGVAVTDSQKQIYDTLKTYGPLPDHALVPLAQHVTQVHQSSSGIRSRRHELSDKGLVGDTGDRIVMPSGRKAKVYEVVR